MLWILTVGALNRPLKEKHGRRSNAAPTINPRPKCVALKISPRILSERRSERLKIEVALDNIALYLNNYDQSVLVIS